MPVSPIPNCNFCITDSTACPPDAQAFSTASIGLPSSPGVIAINPASSPCSFSVKLHAAPIDPTSSAAAATPACRHAP